MLVNNSPKNDVFTGPNPCSRAPINSGPVTDSQTVPDRPAAALDKRAPAGPRTRLTPGRSAVGRHRGGVRARGRWPAGRWWDVPAPWRGAGPGALGAAA